MRRIDRYIFRETLGPLALGFLLYTFILVLNRLFLSAEMIIRRGLPVSVVGKLLLLHLPNIVVITIPMTLLLAILITVGRLSADSELTALRSCGISLSRLYRPILVLSLLLTALNMALMVWVLPWGNHRLQQHLLDIATQSVSKQVQPRIFYHDWEDIMVYVFEMPPEDDRWRGVFVAESLPSTENQVVVAEWGRPRLDEAGERIVLELENAFIHTVNLRNPGDYDVQFYQHLERVVEDRFLSERRENRSVSKSLRELTLEELRQRRRDPEASAEVRNLALVEIHKKFSIPTACLVFGIIAVPLGFDNRRGGRGSGFAISLGIIIFYHLLLSRGEEAAREGMLAPWFAMWLPNLLLAGLGILLSLRRNRDRGLLLPRLDRWLREDLWGWLVRLRGGVGRKRAKASGAAGSKRRRRRLEVGLPKVRLRFPNRLDRYVLFAFFRILILASLFGISLFLIADISEVLDDILKNDVPGDLVFDYYSYLSLQVWFEIAPILVLVTALVTFSLLSRSNEVTAAKALGVSLYRLAIPALVATMLVVALCAYLEAEVLPASNQRVAQIRSQIRGEEPARTYRRADHQWLFGQGRYVYNFLHFDPTQETLQRLQVFEFNSDYQLSRRLFTSTARYTGGEGGEGGGWIFSDGWARSFDRSTSLGYERFEEAVRIDYPETPEYFNEEVLPPEQMSFGELRRYVRNLRESGQSVPDLEVQLHNKIAFPVISLVMTLVALPFAFRLGRQGALYGLGVAIGLAIVFMAVVAFFTTLGEAGALPAVVAVWSPNLVFALLALYLFLGVRT